MILRFSSKDGLFRLNVEPTTTFPDILPQIAEKLPKNVNPQSISVGNRPQGGDFRKIASLKGVTFQQVGLSCVAPPRLAFIADAPPEMARSSSSSLRSSLQRQTAMLQLLQVHLA